MRLLIYSHYNPQNIYSDYVHFMLREMAPFYKRIIFVSNSALSEQQKEKISEIADRIIMRENKGFDFGAWKAAILKEGWEELGKYDYVTLMNDTNFGPMCDLEPIFTEMESRLPDYWGMTKHTDYKSGFLWFGLNIKAHLQSYFMSFSRKVVESDAFQNFWEKVKNLKDVQQVIDKYEIGLSRTLEKAGFTGQSYFPPDTFEKEVNNVATFFYPDKMLQKRFPFLKVKSIFFFQHPKHLKSVVEEFTDYNFQLIEQHITDSFHPNISLSVLDKNLVLPKGDYKKPVSSLSVAIHIHVFYTDEWPRFCSYLEQMESPADLFITTDTEAKKENILSILGDYNLDKMNAEIIITENRGRDVLPWIYISEKLKKYDLVGHFHVKKSPLVFDWIGKTWMYEVTESLLNHADFIFEEFEKNKRLGIVIPDIPYFFKMNNDFESYKKDKEHFFKFWKQLGLSKTLDEEEFYKIIMSYGNMFWYRPPALEPLTNYEKFGEHFTEEPLGTGGTLAHSFEASTVYVAWNQNYDFRVTINQDYIFSGFDVENKSAASSIFNKYAWKIGKAVIWLPRKIRRYLRGEDY